MTTPPGTMAKASAADHLSALRDNATLAGMHRWNASNAERNGETFTHAEHLHLSSAHEHLCDAHAAMLHGDRATASEHIARAVHHSAEASRNSGIHLTDHDHWDYEPEQDYDDAPTPHLTLAENIGAAQQMHQGAHTNPLPLLPRAIPPHPGTNPSADGHHPNVMQKGVLDSIRNMMRGGKAKQGNTGPTTRVQAHAAAPVNKPGQLPKLSGRADDHDYHSSGITHLTQTDPRVQGSMQTSLTHLNSAHQNMKKARQAYDKGDTHTAGKFMEGARNFLQHAHEASPQTVAFHGDVLSSRIKEMGNAIGQHGNHAHNTHSMAKAETVNPNFTHMVRGMIRSR
ncbi:hypothetical protein [Deinococcus sp. 23YEL01]|uniref:hypothetical protein n=1 Tax=Deinococcus sp. 23YEL01 TaxID=2745871 RepID=UPI001E2A924E|nr:hypothetical protein [Deinococcus sp. 23YEL01]MCD0168058.1 hypothetical protein [Deinococcus sp. 23YEL01]